MEEEVEPPETDSEHEGGTYSTSLSEGTGTPEEPDLEEPEERQVDILRIHMELRVKFVVE